MAAARDIPGFVRKEKWEMGEGGKRGEGRVGDTGCLGCVGVEGIGRNNAHTGVFPCIFGCSRGRQVRGFSHIYIYILEYKGELCTMKRMRRVLRRV
jgi:hypothetical protein